MAADSTRVRMKVPLNRMVIRETISKISKGTMEEINKPTDTDNSNNRVPRAVLHLIGAEMVMTLQKRS